jgi:integrase
MGRRRRNLISVYAPKRHGKKWRIRIRDGATGEIRYTTYDTEEAATKGYSRLRREVANYQSATIGEIMGMYRQDQTARGLKTSSMKTTEYRLNAIFSDLVDTPISMVSKIDLTKRFEVRRLEIKPDTARNEIAELKVFYRWAVDKNLIDKSMAEEISPRYAGKRNKGKQQLRPTESKAFFDLALSQANSGNQASLACATVLLLGLRASEITKRLVRDLDCMTKTLHIEDAKTRAGERTVEIPEVLWSLLESQTKGRFPADPLFCAPTRSGHHDVGWIRKHTKTLCEKLGIPVVTAHGLRGTHATLAKKAGATGHLVAGQLGHTNERVTQDHYIAFDAEEQERRRQVFKVVVGGR